MIGKLKTLMQIYVKFSGQSKMFYWIFCNLWQSLAGSVATRGTPLGIGSFSWHIFIIDKVGQINCKLCFLYEQVPWTAKPRSAKMAYTNSIVGRLCVVVCVFTVRRTFQTRQRSTNMNQQALGAFFSHVICHSNDRRRKLSI